jgi:hypothetical protein
VGSVLASRELAADDLHKVDTWQSVIKSVANDVAEDIRSRFVAYGYVVRPKTLPPKTADKPIVSFSPAKVDPIQPWTGKWNVEGLTSVKGSWAMKQIGRIVKSTKYSYYEIEGKVQGNKL